MFKVGDKVVITGNYLHNESVGCTGKVTKVYAEDNFCRVNVLEDPVYRRVKGVTWSVKFCDLRRIGNVLNK